MTEKSEECLKPSTGTTQKIPPIVAKPGGYEKGYTEIIQKALPKKKGPENRIL